MHTQFYFCFFKWGYNKLLYILKYAVTKVVTVQICKLSTLYLSWTKILICHTKLFLCLSKAPVRNSKLWVHDISFCHGITNFIIFFTQFQWNIMEIWEKLPKTIVSSTHTFKNCGCWSTHCTHTNRGPVKISNILWLSE